MSRLVFLLLLAIGLVIGAVAFAPLTTVLDLAGVRKSGLDWTSSSGTLLNGRMEGIRINEKNYGDAGLKLKPAALLGGALAYKVNWTGAAGSGAGDVALSSVRSFSLKDYKADLDLLSLEHAALWIQQSGGRVMLDGRLIRFKDGACAEAEGTARSDVLERNRAVLGDGWGEMSGALTCDAGDLVVPLESTHAAGTRFGAQLRLRPGLPGRFEARVSGMISRELGYMLPLAGFRKDGADYIYSFSPAAGGNPI